MNRTLPFAVALTTAIVTPNTLADGPLLWSDNSFSYLYGKQFEVNPPIQQTVTFEHASSWAIGDLFTFVDYTEYNGQQDANNDGERLAELGGKDEGEQLGFVADFGQGDDAG